MKQFFAFVKKESYHIFRDRRTMLILLIMPIIEILLFGFAITTEIQNINIAVVDHSKDVSSSRIIHQIEGNPYYTVVGNYPDVAEAYRAMSRGEINLALVFEPGFDEQLRHEGSSAVQILTDATDPNTSTMMLTYTRNLLASYQQELQEGQSTGYRIFPQIKLLYNPQMKGAYNFVPGVMGLIFMLICAMMTAISIVREKERGTMEVLLVSPIKPIFIIIAKAVPYFVLSCVNLATILLLSVYVLDVPIAGSLALLLGLSVLFIFVSLALGLLVSTIVTTQVAAMLVSGMVLMMPVMLLSGMIFPVESMPLPLQILSHAIPARWFIAAVKKVMIEGLELRYWLNEVVILTGMLALLLAVSLKKFKKRLE